MTPMMILGGLAFLMFLASADTGIGALFSGGSSEGDDDTDSTEDTSPTEDESLTAGVSETGGDDILSVAAGQLTTGGDADETFVLDGAADATLAVDAQGGDDTIDFFDPATVTDHDSFEAAQLDGATILGGEGDDLIDLLARATQVQGEAGDDTISGDVSGSTIAGGAGDDLINLTGAGNPYDSDDAPEGNAVFGGYGDDIIVADMSGGSVDAGPGDDTVLVTTGHGAATEVFGGAGQDAIYAITETLPLDAGSTGFSFTGGPDADSFVVVLDATVISNGNWAGGHVTQSSEGVMELDLGTIRDFEPGYDALHLVDQTLVPGTAAYGLTGVDIEELADRSVPSGVSTMVTLTYEAEGELTRELYFTLAGAEGLTVDDLTLSGSAAVPVTVLPLAA